MIKRFYLPVAIALCFLVIVPDSRPVFAKDKWISVRSENFFLLSNGGEKDLRRVAARLEQFREVLTRLLPTIKFTSSVPTTVIVFKSESSYRPFKDSANTAGYFQPGPDVNYITLTTELQGNQNTFNVIFHEYTHLLVNNTLGNAPAWFNEGLAECYSTFSISDDQKVVLGTPIANHVYLLRANKMLPLKTLFQVDHKSPYYNERDKQSIFYAQSWALMHYLIFGNGGQRVASMGKFLNLADAGMPMEEAFQQAFQTTYEKMEKELREYIKRDRYPVTSGHFERKLEVDTDLQVGAITEAEAQGYLGDLLLHSNRADAEGYLKKALALNPNLPLANASLAMLRVRQGKIDEARQSLEKAASANSQNYLIHYYYAYALSREGMGETQIVTSYAPELLEKMRAELKKSIELRPDFPESHSLLAFVSLVSGSQIDESTESLKRLLKTSPGRNDLQFMLAQLYLRKQDLKASRQILERLSQNSADEEVRQQSKALLAQLISNEENVARHQAFRESRATDSRDKPANSEIVVTADQVIDPKTEDPNQYLREALRKPAADESQAEGILVRIDCDAKGITVVVKAGERLLRLKAENFESLDLTTFSPDVAGTISCGARQQENAVIVCYLPKSDTKSKSDGLVRSIEFVPKTFKLKPQP